VKVKSALILGALSVTGTPVPAEVPHVERERIAACFEAQDWTCTFDGLVTAYEKRENIEGCLADERHGCGYEMITIYVSGIGSAANANAAGRRNIAERALAVLSPMSEGEIEAQGEIAFSALRYDACKAAGDQDCMAESADLMRRANANEDLDDDLGDMVRMLGEFGVQYPLDLALVMKDAAGMEKKE
jgi:hypothetical protein